MSLDSRQLAANLSNIPLQELAALEQGRQPTAPYTAALAGPTITPTGATPVQVTPLPTIGSPDPQTVAFLKALNQQYSQPTSSLPQFIVPNAPIVTGQSLPSDVLQRLSAVIQGHPVMTGLAPPQPSSYVLNTIGRGLPKKTLTGTAEGPFQVAMSVAKDVWDSTGGAFVHTLQTHPEQAILQFGEMAAVGAGLVIVGALAAPEVAAGVAIGLGVLAIAQTLPGTIGATLDEVHNPTDQNLAKVLVGVGTLGLAASPLAGYRSLALAKIGLGTQILRTRASYNTGDLVTNVLSGTADWRSNLKATLPIAQQLKQLPLHPDQLEAELKAAGLDASPNKATQYLVNQLRRTTQAAHALEDAMKNSTTGTIERAELEAELKKQAEGDLTEYRKQFGFRYGYRPEFRPEGSTAPESFDILNDPQHVKDFEATPEGMQYLRNIDRHWHPMMGIIQAAQELRGYISRPDIAQVMEHGMRGIASSAFRTAHDEVMTQILGMAREAGLNLAGEDGTRIWDALEDQSLAVKLTPKEHILANRLAWMMNAKSVGEGRHGFVGQLLAGRVARFRISRPIPGVEPTRDPSRGLRDGLLRRMIPVHRIWKASVESRVGDPLAPGSEEGAELALQQKYPTAKAWRADQAALDQSYEGTRPLRDYHTQHKDEIRQARISAGAKKGAVTRAQNRLREAENELRTLQEEGAPTGGRYTDEAKQLENDLAAVQREGHPDDWYKRFTPTGSKTPLKKGETWRSRAEDRLAIIKRLAVEEGETTGGTDPEAVRLAQQAVSDAEESINAANLKLQQHMDNQPNDVHRQLVQMPKRELDRALNARPGGYDLLNFRDTLSTDLYRYFADMSLAGTRHALSTIANTSASSIADQLGVGVSRHLSYEIQRAVSEGQMTTDQLPKVLEETAFGQGPKTGYKEILPAIGRKEDLNYQPAIYAQDKLADEWLSELNKMQGADEWAGAFGKTFYKWFINIPKRAIFVSPAWHAFNVSGRLIAHVLQNPVVAGNQIMMAVKLARDDPQAWEALKFQMWRDGGVPAHRYNVSNHVNHLEQEATGQYTWPGVLRGLEPMANRYADTVESGFWGLVDDMQTVGYFFAKERFKAAIPGVSDEQAGMAAAEYANNLAGMTNPLYMSRAWKFIRGGIWFAPSYWASFTRMAASALPGAARMSHFLAQREGTMGMVVNPVRLKSLDFNVRKELIRQQRSWFMTYMATSVVAADMMNMITSGHHMWDNPKGREFDICFDRTASPRQDASGTLKSACMSSLPFFRQGADVANALGFGHDWGFAHQLSNPAWQKANAVQKGIMAFQALGQGIQRGYANKFSTGVTAAFEGITGADASALFGQGKIQTIPRWEAMLSLVPGGYSAQRAVQQGPLPTAGEAATSFTSQALGIPSVYWMGDERPLIDDHAWNNYSTQRTAIQQEQLKASQALMSGSNTPYDWLQDRDKAEAKLAQLEVDTFGDSSPGGVVASKYFDLRSQYGLDDPTATQSDIFQRLQLFDDAWNKQLENADPVSKAIWWDHTRLQWTDADYLYWLSKQVKSSLEGMIDGEAGQRVFAVNQKYGPLENLPGVNPTLISNLKQSDPFYAMYHSLLKELGQVSPLGALVSAFTNPYSQSVILPAGMTADVANNLQNQLTAAGVQDALFPSSARLVSGATAGKLVAGAKALANTPETQAAGGQAGGTPEFQQQVMTPMLRQAILQAAADYPNDPNIQALAGQIGGA